MSASTRRLLPQARWRRIGEPLRRPRGASPARCIANRRMGGLKTAICLLGAILLAGCTTTKAPDVPTFQSYFGQACARVCQREHDLCTSRCTQMVNLGCKSECSQKLKECYDFCLVEESKKSP